MECLAIRESFIYCRHGLLEIDFVVFSDDKPLQNLKINTKFDDKLRELMLHLTLFPVVTGLKDSIKIYTKYNYFKKKS